MHKIYTDTPEMYYKLKREHLFLCHTCAQRKAIWSNASTLNTHYLGVSFMANFKRFCQGCFDTYFKTTDTTIVNKLRERHDVLT